MSVLPRLEYAKSAPFNGIKTHENSESPALRAPAAGRTPLEKHVAFFDRDGDGRITLGETFAGCRAIGANPAVSGLAAVLINGAMGWPTARSWLPTTTIHVGHIGRAMHGSDTGVYDQHGNFDAAKFDAMFDTYDTDHDGYWNLSEFLQRTRAQRDTFDLFGQTATVLEFGMLYYLVGRGGRISRDTLRKVYDGSLFYEMEAEQRAGRDPKRAEG